MTIEIHSHCKQMGSSGTVTNCAKNASKAFRCSENSTWETVASCPDKKCIERIGLQGRSEHPFADFHSNRQVFAKVILH
jgi:hypothetical protein